MLMRAYRMEQPARCTQEGLLALMADRNPEYANKYNHSTVSRKETGQRMPSRADIETFGQALRLSRQETHGLIRLAGYPTPADGLDDDSHRHDPSDHQTLVSKDGEGDALQSRADGSPGIANDYTIGIKYGLWRAAIPGLYIAGVGYALTAFGLRTIWILVAYVIIALGNNDAQGDVAAAGCEQYQRVSIRIPILPAEHPYVAVRSHRDGRVRLLFHSGFRGHSVPPATDIDSEFSDFPSSRVHIRCLEEVA